MKHTVLLLAAGLACLSATSASAVPVSWTDWTSATSTTADGAMNVGGTSVGVAFSNSATSAFVQTGAGTNYFTGGNFSGGGMMPDAAPTAAEMVGLANAGTRTFTFSQTVHDIYVAIVSLNNGPITFSAAAEVIGVGCGYWGCGTASASGSVVNTNGEAHGILRLSGDFDSFSFTTPYEYWHGVTIGVGGLAEAVPASVPLPASGLALIAGLGGLAALRRAKKMAGL